MPLYYQYLRFVARYDALGSGQDEPGCYQGSRTVVKDGSVLADGSNLDPGHVWELGACGHKLPVDNAGLTFTSYTLSSETKQKYGMLLVYLHKSRFSIITRTVLETSYIREDT
jgi:hypothetical protein